CWAGDKPHNAIGATWPVPREESRTQLTEHEATPLSLVAIKSQVTPPKPAAVQEEVGLPQGWLVVLTRERLNVTLKEARVRPVGGRSFVIGTEVDNPQITKPMFVGMLVWMPLDDVIQIVEYKKP